MKPLQIIGCGPGARNFLTLAALSAAQSCDCLIGAPHLLALFPEFSGPQLPCPTHAHAAIEHITHLRTRYATLGILVTGDTGLCSLASPLLQHFGPELCTLHPGISSVQLACARLGLSWEQAHLISAHALVPSIIPPELSRYTLIIVLAGTPAALQWCATLQTTLGTRYTTTLCSDLGLTTESIITQPVWEQIQHRSRSLVLFQQKKTP